MTPPSPGRLKGSNGCKEQAERTSYGSLGRHLLSDSMNALVDQKPELSTNYMCYTHLSSRLKLAVACSPDSVPGNGDHSCKSFGVKSHTS
jgi:hypothetical protein